MIRTVVLDAGADATIATKDGHTPVELAYMSSYSRSLSILLPPSGTRAVQRVLVLAAKTAAKKSVLTAQVLRDPLLRCILRSPAVTDTIISGAIKSVGSQIENNRAAGERLASEARTCELGASAAAAASGSDTTIISLALQRNARDKRLAIEVNTIGTHMALLPLC